MKIRGLIISMLGLLDSLLKQKNDETTLRRKERIIGGVLLFIGLFVAAVDNL